MANTRTLSSGILETHNPESNSYTYTSPAARQLSFLPGESASTLQATGSIANTVGSNVPNASAAQNFNARLVEMLKQYQQLGTKPFAEQALNAEAAQAGRVLQTPSNLIGASPALQSSVRSADVSALSPTVQGAQNSQKTFSEQISGLGNAITQAQNLVQTFEAQQQTQVENARKVVDYALASGSDGLNAFLSTKEGEATIKAAGLNKETLAAMVPYLKKQEQDAAELSRLERANIQSQIADRAKSGIVGQPSTYSVDTANRMLAAVNDLLPRVSNVTVGAGSLASFVPGSSAADFQADLKTLQANIAFNALQAMREASKSGGALGQVSERELALLESTLGALDTAQSPDNFRKNLGNIKDSVRRWQIAVEQAQSSGKITGGPSSSDPLGIR